MNRLAPALLFSFIPLFCAEEPLPKAETVLDHWLQVTGGQAAWENRRNVVQHGTIYFSARGIQGTITLYQAAPDQSLAILELDGLGKIESGSNGAVAWENSVLQGPRIKQGAERTDALRDATFNASLHWRKLYAKADTAGIETVEGRECYRIVLTPPQGQPTTEYFDKQSGLLVKTAASRNTPRGLVTGEIVYEDYKKEGDLLIPHKLINRMGGQEFQIVVQSAEVNVDLPKERFDLPPEIQALVKKTDQPGANPVPTPPSGGRDGQTQPAISRPAAASGAAKGS